MKQHHDLIICWIAGFAICFLACWFFAKEDKNFIQENAFDNLVLLPAFCTFAPCAAFAVWLIIKFKS